MGLAPLMVAKIFEIVRDIAARGVTILLVEQNARLALEVAQPRLRHGVGRHHLVGRRRDAAATIRASARRISAKAPAKRPSS